MLEGQPHGDSATVPASAPFLRLGADLIPRIWPKGAIVKGFCVSKTIRQFLRCSMQADFLVRPRYSPDPSDVAATLKHFLAPECCFTFSSGEDQTLMALQGICQALESGWSGKIRSLSLSMGHFRTPSAGRTFSNLLQQASWSLSQVVFANRKACVNPRVLIDVAFGLKYCKNLEVLDLQNAIKTFTISSDSSEFGGPPETIQGDSPRLLDENGEIRDVTAALTLILQNCTRLKSLDLEGLVLQQGTDQSEFMSALSGCSRITYLNLGRDKLCRHIHFLGRTFAQVLVTLKNLTILGLRGVFHNELNSQSPDFAALLEGIRALKALKRADFGDQELSMEGLHLLVASLASCSNLSSLFLNRTPNAEDPLGATPNPGIHLARMQSLTFLDLSNLRLDYACARETVLHLESLRSLMFLNLACSSRDRGRERYECNLEHLLIKQQPQLQVFSDVNDGEGLRLRFFKGLPTVYG